MEYVVVCAFWLIILIMAIAASVLFCMLVDGIREKRLSERELSDKLLMEYLDIQFSDETERQSTRRKIDTLECIAIELRMKLDAREVAGDFKHIKNKKHGKRKQKANSE